MFVVLYRVAPQHYAETIKGEETLHGSVHHAELRQFTGLITREHEDGHCDLILFAPGRVPIHVEHVAEGEAPGEFSRV